MQEIIKLAQKLINYILTISCFFIVGLFYSGLINSYVSIDILFVIGLLYFVISKIVRDRFIDEWYDKYLVLEPGKMKELEIETPGDFINFLWVTIKSDPVILDKQTIKQIKNTLIFLSDKSKMGYEISFKSNKKLQKIFLKNIGYMKNINGNDKNIKITLED